jgi:gluconate 2-dehydrogenase gamma chain
MKRRFFLKSVTAMSAVPAAAFAQEKHPHGHAALGTVKGQPQPQVYTFLTQPEIAFVEAAVARLIPNDQTGPGAKEAGVSFFIDHQLAGPYGTMAKNYKQGPWPEGTPQQGYQSRLTPQEIYRVAIAEIDSICKKNPGKSFAELPPAEQDRILGEIESGKFPIESVPPAFFFNLLLNGTMEGFFADPIYGGNRDKIGWKLVGFPGVAAAYTDHIERHGVPYEAKPVSIADIQQNLAEVDEHGHPKHVLLSRKD